MGFWLKYKKPSWRKALFFVLIPVVVIGTLFLINNIYNIIFKETIKLPISHFLIFLLILFYSFLTTVRMAGSTGVSLGYAICFAGVLLFGRDTVSIAIFLIAVLIGYRKTKKVNMIILFNACKNVVAVNLIGLFFTALQKITAIISIENTMAIIVAILLPFVLDIIITGMASSCVTSRIPYKDSAGFTDYLVRNFGIGSMQYLFTPLVGLVIVWSYKASFFLILFAGATALLVNWLLRKKQKRIEDFRQRIRKIIQEIHGYHAGTGLHSDRVHAFAAMICSRLGKSAEFSKKVELAASLHDYGKIKVSIEILNFPGRLSKEQFAIMKQHATFSQELIEKIPGISQEIAFWASSHHEKFDGTGYPQGLKGEEIPEATLIIAVADVIAALIEEREYKRGWPIERVQKAIEEGTGLYFEHKIGKTGAELLQTLATQGSAKTFILDKEVINY